MSIKVQFGRICIYPCWIQRLGVTKNRHLSKTWNLGNKSKINYNPRLTPNTYDTNYAYIGRVYPKLKYWRLKLMIIVSLDTLPPTSDIRTLKWYSSCGVRRYILIFFLFIAIFFFHTILMSIFRQFSEVLFIDFLD